MLLRIASYDNLSITIVESPISTYNNIKSLFSLRNCVFIHFYKESFAKCLDLADLLPVSDLIKLLSHKKGYVS